jgi:hypothetical protein
MCSEAGPVAKSFYRRLLMGSEPEVVQVAFAVGVLDKYREAGLAVKRTNTVGRVSAAGWKIDFGIGPGDAALHASLADLLRLPEEERRHWAIHLAQLPFSENYLKMLLHPGSCIDDGDTRDW